MGVGVGGERKKADLQLLTRHRICLCKYGHDGRLILEPLQEGHVRPLATVGREEVEDHVYTEVSLALVRQLALGARLLREVAVEARLDVVGGDAEGGRQIDRVAVPGRIHQLGREGEAVPIERDRLLVD